MPTAGRGFVTDNIENEKRQDDKAKDVVQRARRRGEQSRVNKKGIVQREQKSKR